MNTIALLEILTLFIDLYYKHAEMEGLTPDEIEVRLDKAIAEKRKRKADHLPDV
jgi:hypothetical protein